MLKWLEHRTLAILLVFSIHRINGILGNQFHFSDANVVQIYETTKLIGIKMKFLAKNMLYVENIVYLCSQNVDKWKKIAKYNSGFA